MNTDKELKLCPFKFTKVDNGILQIHYSNGKYIGDLYQEVHGEYVYSACTTGGYWPAWAMRILADKLDELNTRTKEEDGL